MTNTETIKARSGVHWDQVLITAEECYQTDFSAARSWDEHLCMAYTRVCQSGAEALNLLQRGSSGLAGNDALMASR